MGANARKYTNLPPKLSQDVHLNLHPKMQIEVVSYNPIWPHHFLQIKRELESTLKNVQYISIEHVGSTSVPNLAAKPIIDIDIIITPPNLQPAIDALTNPSSGGYAYMGEWGIPDRHAFRKRDAVPVRNLYVCIEGSLSLRNHLAVRDLCRRDEAIRTRYGQMKLELAKREFANMDEYSEAKSEFLKGLLIQAGINVEEAEAVEEQNRQPVA